MENVRYIPRLKDITFNSIRRPRVIFDMDDVIVEYIESVLEDYNKDKNTNYKIKDCTTWTLSDIFGKDILNYLNTKGRFENLKIKRKSTVYIKEIIDSNRYDVFIVTACKPEAYLEKLKWLKTYMPYFNENRLIPATEKSSVWGDVIIDDKADNIIKYIDIMPNAIGLLYNMPHNKDCKNLKRIYSLKNILDVLDDIFYGNISNKEEFIQDVVK